MSKEIWIPLNEYSNKHKVSVSTLRRRIRSSKIEFKFENGKYLLMDQAPHRSNSKTRGSVSANEPKVEIKNSNDMMSAEGLIRKSGEENIRESSDSPVLATAHRILNELKKAYSLALQQKEEQVLILKNEVSDLQTLVRVLEDENKRLSREQKENSGTYRSAPTESWTTF